MMKALVALCLLAGACSCQFTFTVDSADFFDRSLIQPKNTFPAPGRDSEDISPQLTFRNVPSDAKSLAIVVSDADAEPVVGTTVFHWVIFNIPPDTESLEPGEVPVGARQAINVFGNPQYDGPGPPNGRSHAYTFTLHALDIMLSSPDGAPTDDAVNQIEFHSIQRTQIVGWFTNSFEDDTSATEFSISSEEIADGGVIPIEFTQDAPAAPQSPPFAFDNIPAAAETLILVMDDPDTPGGLFVHWVVYNIPANTTGFDLGVVPDGAVQGLNGAGTRDYLGPAPPVGDAAHHYRFTLTAVSGTVTPPDPTADDKPAVMNAAFFGPGILQQVIMTGLYASRTGDDDPTAISGANPRMTISSEDFSPFGVLPINYTFFGENISPELRFSGIPDDAGSLVLIVRDPDAPGSEVFHWTVFDIPVPAGGDLTVAEDSVPAQGVEGTPFAGPHPPAGPAHGYRFQLYALEEETLGLDEGAAPEEILRAIEGSNLLAFDEIVAYFAARPVSKMLLTSPSFPNFGIIPDRFTSIVGDSINPALNFGDIPDGTETLVFVIDDPDAPVPGHVFDHWVIYNIPVDARGIPENGIPDGALEGVNGAGDVGYLGPAPPDGAAHHYHFTLYATDTTLQFDSPPSKTDVLGSLHGHVLQETELIGLYGVFPGEVDNNGLPGTVTEEDGMTKTEKAFLGLMIVFAVIAVVSFTACCYYRSKRAHINGMSTTTRRGSEMASRKPQYESLAGQPQNLGG